MRHLRSIVLFVCVASSGLLAAPGIAGAAGPAPEPALGATDWKQVDGDGGHTCAVKTTGRLFCWGEDTNGTLGDDATIANQPTPVEVADGATDWKQVSAGDYHTCAVKTSGRLFCWGTDGGRLGDDVTSASKPTPVEVFGGATNWKQVSAGIDHTCALKTSGRLFCWGLDNQGQLGDDATIATQFLPVQVAGAAKNWKQVSAGGSHTCALKTNERAYCWGDDGSGQLGDDATEADQPTPVQVFGAAKTWKQISAGDNQTCAVKDSRRAYCWGEDSFGKLGDDSNLAQKNMPTELSGATKDWKQVAAGRNHNCARKTSGQLFCWGGDFNGNLGDDATLAEKHTPVEVSGAATDWKQVAAANGHTCALMTSRRLFCWGSDGAGQLGDDATLAAEPTPVEVAG